MGDVVSIGTKKVVQVADDQPPLTSGSVTEPEVFLLGEEEISDFLFLVNTLDQADTPAWQRKVMADIKKRVEGWPDG